MQALGPWTARGVGIIASFLFTFVIALFHERQVPSASSDIIAQQLRLSTSGAADVQQGGSSRPLQEELDDVGLMLQWNQTTPQRGLNLDSDQWDNSMAVCAIMKNENVSDVLEWLQYHKCVHTSTLIVPVQSPFFMLAV